MKLLMVMKYRREQSSVIMHPSPDREAARRLRNYFQHAMMTSGDPKDVGLCLMVEDGYEEMS